MAGSRAASLLSEQCFEDLTLLSEDKTHHTPNKVFICPWNSYDNSNWGEREKIYNNDLKPVHMAPPQGLPQVEEPNWPVIHQPYMDMTRLTWCGHATFLVQLDGFNILTDPLLTFRASPVTWAGPARYTPLPTNILEPHNLPQIHLVVLSHDHYDHTNAQTIRFLISKDRLLALRKALKQRQQCEERVTLVELPTPISATMAAATASSNVDLSSASASEVSSSLSTPMPCPELDDPSQLKQSSSQPPAKSPDAETMQLRSDLAPHFCVPLRLRALLISEGVPESHIHELDWWQTRGFELQSAATSSSTSSPTNDSTTSSSSVASLVAVCLPSQHSGGRAIADRNLSLWCSWALIGPHHRVYFAGATGLRSVPRGSVANSEFGVDSETKEIAVLHDLDLPVCPAFAQIGATLGPFDLALLPIGNYSPRWFMSPHHLNPLDAVLVHQLVRARRSIGMMWGTFRMTDEPIWDPPERLIRELERTGLPGDEFIIVKHGETNVFD